MSRSVLYKGSNSKTRIGSGRTSVITPKCVETFLALRSRRLMYLPHMSTPCRPWLGSISTSGTAMHGWWEHNHSNSITVAQLVVRWFHRGGGELKPHEHALHLCDALTCTEAEHLVIGTDAQNREHLRRRKSARGRGIMAREIEFQVQHRFRPSAWVTQNLYLHPQYEEIACGYSFPA